VPHIGLQVNNGLDATPLADSGIDDQWMKLHSLIDQMCFRSLVSFFVVCYFQRKTFNITKLL